MREISKMLHSQKTSDDLLTYEDYMTFPDNDGIRKEIIEGDLFMTPAPSIQHQRILRKLSIILDNYVDMNRLGEILFAPCDIIFSDINVVQPDLIFVSRDNYQIRTELNIQGAPDLLVEILSASTKDSDRIFKKHIYEKFHVKEYWIIDPGEETIEIWALKNRKYHLFCKANKKVSLKSMILSGLRIDLASIF